MRPRYDYGAEVRVIRTVRNDGTYPGVATGAVLVRRGSIGYVRDVGTFLQDQLIYSVDFLNEQIRVGCREQELQLATADWVPTRFEFRDKVVPTLSLAIAGDIVAAPGDIGEIEKVLPDSEGGPCYHVRFHGRTLMVSEQSLELSNLES
ncbi:nitrogen fixation protein NifZ [Ectothiorhodospiraceae bacterium BW-2]|nr:nitrogen fixation protein NifZ [Ectothiorhodospiraceae bacterium BW-2]